jgi:hypothetical protein
LESLLIEPLRGNWRSCWGVHLPSSAEASVRAMPRQGGPSEGLRELHWLIPGSHEGIGSWAEQARLADLPIGRRMASCPTTNRCGTFSGDGRLMR